MRGAGHCQGCHVMSWSPSVNNLQAVIMAKVFALSAHDSALFPQEIS